MFNLNIILNNPLRLFKFQHAISTCQYFFRKPQNINENSDIVDCELNDLRNIERNMFNNYKNEETDVLPATVRTNSILKSYKKQIIRKPKITKSFNLKAFELETFPSSNQIEEKALESVKIKKREKVKSDKIFDNELNLSYTKLQLNDPLLATLILSGKSKKRRLQKQQILLEGKRLIKDGLLSNNIQLEYLLFSQKEKLNSIKDDLIVLNYKYNLIKVPYSDLQLWSNLTTCPGLIGIFTKLNDDETCSSIITTDNDKIGRLPITVICDNIREPNNLGSIIRICAAVPCKEIILMKGCTDPYDPKCLRGGSGGHFCINIKYAVEWNDIKKVLPNNYNVYIADNNLEQAKSNFENFHQHNHENSYHSASFEDLLSYDKLMYSKLKHNIVIIGGETHGISINAYKYLIENGGNHNSVLNIPLYGGIDSLNTSTALGIILFEIRKQMQREVK